MELKHTYFTFYAVYDNLGNQIILCDNKYYSILNYLNQTFKC